MGLEQAISRGLAYAPYADLIWCETGKPDLEKRSSSPRPSTSEVPRQDAGLQLLAVFNWKKNLDDATIAKFQRELGAMGYKFQFITLAGFHALNFSMFTLAKGYKERQMSAYVELQEPSSPAEALGYTATKHQREVGAATSTRSTK
jgi:isocitrate lyase